MSAYERITINVSKEFADDLRRLVPRKQRSMFVAAAASERLKLLKQRKALEGAAGTWKNEDHPELAKAGVDNWVRELRGSWGGRAQPDKKPKRG